MHEGLWWEFLILGVTGVLNPNNQYNIYWIKYNCLSKKLFLSWSYPRTEPLAPALQEQPIYICTKALCPGIYRLHFPIE